MTLMEETKVSRKSIKWLYLLWAVLVLTGAAWVVVTASVLFFQPPPAEFVSASITNKSITPTGKPSIEGSPGLLRMKTILVTPLDPACLMGTQYFLEFPDGTQMKLPGVRTSLPGRARMVMYETSVPRYAPVGPAEFWIRDNYNCGIQARRADSPRIPFEVMTMPKASKLK